MNNICQSLGRDLFIDKAIKIEAAGERALHTEQKHLSLDEIQAIMSETPPWMRQTAEVKYFKHTDKGFELDRNTKVGHPQGVRLGAETMNTGFCYLKSLDTAPERTLVASHGATKIARIEGENNTYRLIQGNAGETVPSNQIKPTMQRVVGGLENWSYVQPAFGKSLLEPLTIANRTPEKTNER